jgi:hypothetical protein
MRKDDPKQPSVNVEEYVAYMYEAGQNKRQREHEQKMVEAKLKQARYEAMAEERRLETEKLRQTPQALQMQKLRVEELQLELKLRGMCSAPVPSDDPPMIVTTDRNSTHPMPPLTPSQLLVPQGQHPSSGTGVGETESLTDFLHGLDMTGLDTLGSSHSSRMS